MHYTGHVRMFDYLSEFSRLIVTGPWRSGTTIAGHMIAQDTGKRYIDEWEFGATDKSRWHKMVLEETNYVMQAPCMCRYVHEYGDIDGLGIVLMRRPIKDIIKSQERINMSGFETELERYGVKEGVLCEIKYDFWDNYQIDKITNAFEIQYDDLADHPLFLPKRHRRNFSPKQWKL